MDENENVSEVIPEGTRPVRVKRRNGTDKSQADADRAREEKAKALRYRHGPDSDDNMHGQ